MVAWGDTTRTVQGCTATLIQNKSTANSPQPYKFVFKEYTKIDGLGVVQRIEHGNRSRKDIAAEDTGGQWVLFEHMTNSGNQIGRVLELVFERSRAVR